MDVDCGAYLQLPDPQKYSALDIWAYDSAEELKVCIRRPLCFLQCCGHTRALVIV